ncbi:MAG: hypothetical protein ABR502_00295 [Chitinophagaceae bacterium]
MKSLVTCLNRMEMEGYTEHFKMTDRGLEALQQQKNYHPDQVQVVNCFKFEGNADKNNNAVLFVIEANDGTKGTLVDASGIRNNPKICNLIKR